METLMQLFLRGPVWDGNIVDPTQRDLLVSQGHVERWEGWNYLTPFGVRHAVRCAAARAPGTGMLAHRKASLQ